MKNLFTKQQKSDAEGLQFQTFQFCIVGYVSEVSEEKERCTFFTVKVMTSWIKQNSLSCP